MGVTWEIECEPPGRFTVTLEGRLHEGEERDYLEALERRAAPLTGPVTLLFVMRNPSFDYELGCFMPHVQLFRRMWPKLCAVAVAQVPPPVRVGVAAMGLIMTLPVQGFASPGAARAWLQAHEHSVGEILKKRMLR
jgi:hypothetical protein